MNDLQNWTPFKIYPDDRETLIDWCEMNGARFTEPFFEETIRIRRRDDAVRRSVRQTTLEELKILAENSPGISPTGFIFHLSRCGSTLVSQMLAASAKNIVISEAPPIDTIIREQFQTQEISRQARADNLKFLLNAYGQKRFETEEYFFVKFDCWHTLNLNLIVEAFPNVPWIFLYRNPVEVVVSHLRQRGMQMIPGVIRNLLPEFSLEEILRMTAEEYAARVLGRICENALKYAKHPNALLVNYSELPDACLTKISAHFNARYDSADIEKMGVAAKFNAKNPQSAFASDVKSKNAEASEIVHQTIAEYVEPYYRQLEEIRLKSDE